MIRRSMLLFVESVLIAFLIICLHKRCNIHVFPLFPKWWLEEIINLGNKWKETEVVWYGAFWTTGVSYLLLDIRTSMICSVSVQFTCTVFNSFFFFFLSCTTRVYSSCSKLKTNGKSNPQFFIFG